MNSSPRDVVISASEIGDYVYCKRSWWLSKNGQRTPSVQMLQGTLKHNTLSHQVHSYAMDKVILMICLGIVLIISLLILVFTMFHL